jgi:hypothetical protein
MDRPNVLTLEAQFPDTRRAAWPKQPQRSFARATASEASSRLAARELPVADLKDSPGGEGFDR